MLRRLARRVVRSVRLLGYDDPCLPELLPVSRDKMGETYTDLFANWERISTVAYAEEDAFRADPQRRHLIFDRSPSGHWPVRGDPVFSGAPRPSRSTTPTASRST